MSNMDARQELILKAIIEEHIRTAEPVGSKALTDGYGLDVSSATVRNEMVTLEENGYLRQPHTSAGRVPTEKGYSHYIARFVKSSMKQEPSRELRRAVSASHSQEETLRLLAKALVRLSGDMVIAAFGTNRAYYTGFSQLVNKPDFQRLELLQSLTSLLDRFDEITGTVMRGLAEEPQVMIGEYNPFGEETAAVVVKCRLPNGRTVFLGLVGPMRMDYQKNLGLMEQVVEILGKKT